MASEIIRLKEIIEPYGFTFKRHKRHGAIHRISDDKKIIQCSGTASDKYWWRQVLRDLMKYGYIPKGRYW